jgi:iron complex outermembrane receptor protein
MYADQSKSAFATGRRVRALAAASTVSLCAALAHPALAQTADAAAADVQEVVVTGSRVARTGFTAPTPVTTVGAAEIASRAPTTLGETLQALPSFRQSSGPNSSGVLSRAGGQVSADLRGLGNERTLTLVNGRRFVPTTAEGTLDMRLIPTLLVNQIEVVTGGASAAWGSDAVAGVVNLILKERIEGIQGTVQYGQSELGDNKEYRFSLASGVRLWDDRFRVIGGFDYVKNDGIGNPYTRDWGRREFNLITNANFATNGLPNLIIAPGVHTANMTPGGLVVSGPLRGLQFLPNGGTSQYNFGQVFGALMIGGDGSGTNLQNATLLGTPLETLASFAKADYDISDKVSAWAELSGAWAWNGGNSQQPRDAGNLTIQRDNAYLPAAVRAQMAGLGLTTLQVGRLNNDTGVIGLDNQTTTLRGAFGLKGEFGEGWKWDVYYQYGHNRNHLNTGPNNRIQVNWARAIDAVVGPNGQVVCRSTLTAPSNGCIPINIFGDGSAKLNDYAFGTAWFNLNTQQEVYAGSIQGEPFSTWAGPVSIVVGAERRAEKAVGSSDPISQTVQASGALGGWVLGNQAPLYGKYHVQEAFAETVVPLLKDAPFAKNFDLNGAIRRTKYSNSGSVTTWKVGASWTVVPDLRFRATRSRDIRAPNFTELYQNGGSSNTFVFDPVLNASVQVRVISEGNPDLVPEKADTTTAGVVYQSSLLPGFSASLDYYDISVNGVIAGVDAPTVTARCQAGIEEFCTSIVFNPNGTIAFVKNQNRNLNALKTRGFDMEARYELPLSNLHEPLPGNLSVRWLATYVKDLITVDSTGETQRAGKVSDHQRVTGVPHWVSTTDIIYRWDALSVGLQARYIGKGYFNQAALTEGCCKANTVNDNTVPAFIYYSLNGQYEFNVNGRTIQVYGVVNNLFDKDPPNIPAGAAGGIRESSTSAVYYDVIGRAYRLGMRFRF